MPTKLQHKVLMFQHHHWMGVCVCIIKSTLTAATHKFETKTLILDDLIFFFLIESPGTEYSKNQVNLQCILDH